MNQPREFVCIDCGITVVQIIPLHANDQDICAECTWMREVGSDIDDPAERERMLTTLRSFLKD